MGREPEQFNVVDNTSQLTDLPTRILDRTGDRAHILHLILTSISSLYSSIFYSPFSWFIGSLCYYVIRQFHL